MDYRLFPAPRPDKAIRISSLLKAVQERRLDITIPSSFAKLDKVRSIFQRQLPKMPREYIFRQVFDPKHKTLCLLLDNEIVGGICYRPFYDQNFVEIVFCAVESDAQVLGHGGIMMDLFKEHVKTELWYNERSEEKIKRLKNESLVNLRQSESIDREKEYGHMYSSRNIGPNTQRAFEILGYDVLTHQGSAVQYLEPCYARRKESLFLMTYADNYAIGYFKKNGFTTKITTNCWVGCIKDYDGGTIMQGRVLYEINYLKKNDFILQKRAELFTKISRVSSFNTLHPGISPRDFTSVYDIPGMKEAKLTNEMLVQTNRSNNIHHVLEFLLSDLVNHTSAWPFLQPVNPAEVPDYHTVVKNPIDLSKIESKLALYNNIEEFNSDVKLMFRNCYLYNSPGTQYYKCAQILEEFFKERKKIFVKYDYQKNHN